MPKSSGAINGGLMKRSMPGETPVIVINVANIDDAMKKVKSSGGKIVMNKTKVGDMGLYSRFIDPEGNLMGIWQNFK